MKTINLSRTLNLPIDAVTQTFGIIARKGAGKTYLAGKLVEGFLDIKAQVVVLDPVGNWWGLRLAADGKNPGYNIAVLGGHHGDVPLAEDSGKLIAEFIVQESLSCILDVSEFSQSGHKKFVADFTKRLFELKKRQSSPLHVVLEEAQLFCPQRFDARDAGMVGAIEKIIRLGRNYGIGATMVSQRPQSINKEVLNQVECLFVLQINGAHERKAIRDWVDNNATETRAAIGDLPGLEIGEAMVWSPQWLKTFKKHKIGKKKTFDGSATPKMGGKRVEPRRLAKREIASLEKSMSQVIERIAENDPAKLKVEINRLNRELNISHKTAPAPDPKAIQRAVDQAVRGVHSQIKPIIKTLRELAGLAQKAVQGSDDLLESMGKVNGGSSPPPAPIPEKQAPRRTPLPDSENGNKILPAGAVKMVHVLVSMHPRMVTKSQLATLSGFAPGGGTFGNYIRAICNHGMAEKQGNDFMATNLALDTYSHLDPVPTDTENLLRYWQGRLPRGAARMLQVLVNHSGTAISRETLALEIEMEFTGGTFGNYLRALLKNGLAEKSGGQYKASSTFWVG